MTRKQFILSIKESSLKKWEDAQKQTINTFIDWWNYIGRDRCSFCYAFNACKNCPIYRPTINIGACCIEWNNIYMTMFRKKNGEISREEAYRIFIQESAALYRRINEIEFEDTTLFNKSTKDAKNRYQVY